ncbi:MAG TPA: molybdopterin-dependent oxidoreductase [Candidatus Binatia bacterium]|nr:molybdopterin-dependent oxidoreductase [Candidatus Binatia bacterium]
METPLRYFRTDLTPNDAFFVRWHLSGIPTTVDVQSFRLEVNGRVSKPLSLSLSDLQSKFEPVSVVALAQCAGNSRTLFEPRVPGGQWGNGAMGNARWTGVRLKDVLDAAGVLAGAVQAGFRGLDVPPQPKTPAFEKSLQLDHARDGEVMIAYEMNGEPLPMLNGFPVRLIVPGWYATYWVKALSSITVLDQPLKTFWMDTAYRIPDNSGANEEPQHLSSATVPINRMPVHSIFVQPGSGEQLRVGQRYELAGVATDGGSGIRRVETSNDGGQTWSDATLGPDLGKYSWRRWQADWTPVTKGKYRLMVRASSASGETQPTTQWNRSGYQRDIIEHLDVVVS